jgi:hypothetical protein
MGYSSRYHAASLIAVFVALAVGILIGAALGSDVVSGTADSLEEDLGQDLDELRAENSELENALSEERALGQRLYPVLVGARLEGRKVGLIALGNVSEALVDDVRAAIQPSGGDLTMVAVVGEPPEAEALARELVGDRPVMSRSRAIDLAAERAGRALAGMGGDFEVARDLLLTRFSGRSAPLDAVVVARDRPDELDERQEADTDRVERGLLRGLTRAGVVVVGAERSGDDPSQIPFFRELGLSTVDNIDQLAGRFALVLALDGAEGSFGVKDTADGLLPELIEPSLPTP